MTACLKYIDVSHSHISSLVQAKGHAPAWHGLTYLDHFIRDQLAECQSLETMLS